MRAYSVIIAMLLLVNMGCSMRPDWPNPEAEIEKAVGLENLIEFKSKGEPIDSDTLVDGKLSMSDVIRMTLTHDPRIQISLAKLKYALAQSHQARLIPNPILDVTLRWPEGGGSPSVEAGIGADILAILRRPGAVDASDKRLRAMSSNVVTVVLNVLSETQQQFVEVQSLDASLNVINNRKKLLDRLVELARSRLNAGEGTSLDLTTLEAQRVELSVEIAELEIDIRAARLALARLIGLPSGNANWVIVPWELPKVNTADEAKWLEASLTYRPEIQAKLWELKSLGAQVKLTKWAIFEPLEGGVDVEREDGNLSIGPSISVPLPFFDWGQARLEAAEASYYESIHELTLIQRQVVEEVRTEYSAYTRISNAYQQVRDQLIPLLERRLKEADSGFRIGLKEVTPLILAEQDLQAGRAKMIELERRSAKSLIRLYRAVGGSGRSPEVLIN